MIPINTIELLIGPVEHVEQVDDEVYIATPAMHDGVKYDFANINFLRGVVELGYTSGPDKGKVFVFVIYATLHPVGE